MLISDVFMKGGVNWQFPPCQLTLRQNTVHIWYVSLRHGSYHYFSGLEALSTQERIRAGSYKFELDRQRFIARRAILKNVLRRYFGNIQGGYEIKFDDYGKPEVILASGKDRVFISLSHSQNAVIFALSPNARVGIDIEYMKRIEFGSIMRTILPSHFMRKLDSLQESEDVIFYGIWTCLEAYLKAIGIGFSNPLDETFWVNFPFDIFGEKSIDPHWSVIQFNPESDFFSTLIIDSPKIQSCFFKFNEFSRE